MGTIAKILSLLIAAALVCIAADSGRRKLIAPKSVAADSFPITGLVSYWTLDETSGNAADSIGINTFLQSNTVAATNAGVISGARVAVRSTDATGGHFYLTNLTIASSDATWTIGGWIAYRADAMGVDRISVSQHYDNPGNQGWQGGKTSANAIYMSYSTNGTGVQIITVAPSPALASNDYHLVTFSLNTNTMKIHVSYDLQRATNTIAGIYNFGSPNLFCKLMSYTSASFSYMMSGWCDEWFLFDHVITDAELALIYNSGSGRRP